VSVLPRIDDDVDVQVWKLRLQPSGDFDCRIARIAHAEDDLELRVILLAAGTQVSIQTGLFAAAARATTTVPVVGERLVSTRVLQ